MHKKFIVLLLVLGLASTASATVNVWDDFESGYPNGGGGWAGPWSGSSTFDLLQETGNKYLSNDYAGTKSIGRDMTAISENQYSFQLDVRMNARQNTWGTGTTSQIQLREDDGNDPVHLKFEPSFEEFRVGDVWLTDYGQIADDANTAPDALKDLYQDWVTIRVDVDEVAGTIKAYWEENDGDMQFVGNGAIQSGQSDDPLDNIKISTRSGGER